MLTLQIGDKITTFFSNTQEAYAFFCKKCYFFLMTSTLVQDEGEA